MLKLSLNALRVANRGRTIRTVRYLPPVRFNSSQAQMKKRAPTSLANTGRNFKSGSKLEIHNKKYTDDGKLLTIDISERAVAKLKSIAEEEKNPDLALRIAVESGGCHGFQYNLHLSNLAEKTEDDCIFEKDGAHVMIDDASLSILRESVVDYTTELIGSMFKVVDSPYMASSCGCGSSFDFDFSKV